MVVKEVLQRWQSLEDKEHSGRPLEVDNDQFESNHQSWFSYNYKRSFQRTQCWPFCGHCALEANWKVKKFDKWVPCGTDCKSIKTSFWSVVFSYSMQQWTISPLNCDVQKKKKSGLYMTTGNDQLSSWTKKKPISSSQSQICIKKTSQSLFGGLPPVWFTTAFWIPGKPLHLRRTFSKSMRCTKNYKPAAGIDQQKGPALLHDDAWPHVAQTTLQSWKNWAMKFCFICHIHLTSC